MMIRTAIIEDDPIMLERLERVIALADDISVAGTANDVASGRLLIAGGGFDVLLCDLGLPDGDGTSLIEATARLHPDVDIMVVTIFADQKKVLNSIRAGARGYILKDQRLEECVQAIRQVRDGGSPISPIIARQLLKRLQPERVEPEERLTLTEREVQILRILSRGFSTGECAEMLEISPFTVGTHVKNIYRKLEVSSRTEAVFEATSRGLLDEG
jgi:DNA-binding NarL/FixJ family response regulator